MIRLGLPRTCWLAATALLAAGCVPPGDLDATLLNRYSASLARCGPQPRAGQTGLDSLRPLPTRLGPDLKTEPTGTGSVRQIIRTYDVLGQEGDVKRVRVTIVTNTTDYPTPGVPEGQTQTLKTGYEFRTPTVPENVTTVEVQARGKESNAPAIRSATKTLIHMSLDDAILRALANNLEIRVVSFDPAIAYEDMVKAAAEFDWVLFGSASVQDNDQQTVSTSLFGVPSVVNSQTKTNTYQAGIRKKLITGGTVAAAPTFTRTFTSSNDFTSWQSALTVELDQPLLRNAGPEFNLAQLRIARENRKISEAAFRQKVEEITARAISLYWQLVQARRDVAILEELLRATEATLRTVIERFELDATIVEVKQTEAAVAARRADLFSAQKTVFDVQEQLAQLLADPQINLLDDYEILPDSTPSTTPVEINEANEMLLALQYNPQLEQARLAIAVADINVRIARNQTLPLVNLQASSSLTGMDDGFDSSTEILEGGKYLSYALGLTAEYPIGNRAAIAALRSQKFQKLKSVAQLQNAADLVTVQVKERIRQIQTAHRQMVAQRAAVDASLTQLKALQDTEAIRGRLTPEYLQVKLQAQQTAAQAAIGEAQAIASYNSALADLARDTGTVLQAHGVQISQASASCRPMVRFEVPGADIVVPPTAKPVPGEPPASSPAWPIGVTPTSQPGGTPPGEVPYVEPAP